MHINFFGNKFVINYNNHEEIRNQKSEIRNQKSDNRHQTFKIILFLFISVLGLSSNAQGPNLPPGNPVNVVNCFQDFLATDSNSYKILGNQFQLLPTLGLTTFPGSFVLIKGYDLSGFSNLDLLALAPDCEDCYPLSAPHYYPNPVPCGCEEYNLEVTLTPCPTQLCPPLLGILNENVTICCSCDIRSTPPGE